VVYIKQIVPAPGDAPRPLRPSSLKAPSPGWRCPRRCDLFKFPLVIGRVVRKRLEFPALQRKVIEVYNQWHFATGIRPILLIEDASAGTVLIQDQNKGIFTLME
jgi:hypothetical protein